MPELPEVQTIVDDLNRKLKGRRITAVSFDWLKMIKPPSTPRNFARQINGAKILKVERRGKYLKFFLSNGNLLVFHLKMTGHFLFDTPKTRHIHLVFKLTGGRMLSFCDVRKFGTVRVGKKEAVENLPELKNMGPEPLTLKTFDFKPTRRKIKQVLMDPKIIAGIGNIYSDEALWLAKIHPLRRTDSLSPKERAFLLKAIKRVLKKSLGLRGTSVRDYRDTAGEKGEYYDRRLVYHREGEKCLRCGTRIKRLRIAGRSAHFCPKCQKTYY